MPHLLGGGGVMVWCPLSNCDSNGIWTYAGTGGISLRHASGLRRLRMLKHTPSHNTAFCLKPGRRDCVRTCVSDNCERSPWRLLLRLPLRNARQTREKSRVLAQLISIRGRRLFWNPARLLVGQFDARLENRKFDDSCPVAQEWTDSRTKQW